MGRSRHGRRSRCSSHTARTRAAEKRSIESLEGRILFAIFTWDGGGGDANWMTAANWAGDVAPVGDGTDDLVFPVGAAQQSNNNDFPDGTGFTSITLQDSGYTLAGNGVAIGASGISDTSAAGANTVSLPLVLGGATTISDSAGNSSNALTLSGVISGSGSLTKSGSGSLILTAANAYTGGTTLSAGNTFANNSSGSAFGTGAVNNSSGTLRGNGGFTGALSNNSGLAPGATNPGPGSIGTIATGDFTIGASGNYSVNVFGTTAGSGYDQLVVTGSVDLGSGHALNTSGTYSGVEGDKLFIIVNDGTDPVSGTFASLGNPTDTVSINGVDYFISYTGDSGTGALTGGNDVVLYVATPNTAPVNTVPGAQTTNEDTPVTFSSGNNNAISISDADAGSANVRVHLTVNASAKVNLPTGGLITAGANNSSDVTLTGSQSAINAALDGMSVSPAVNSSSTITLTVDTNDLGNSGGGGALSDSDDVTINVTAVNDPPVITVPAAAQDTLVNTSLTFSSGHSNAISLADVDAGSGGVQLTLTAAHGMLSLGSTSGLSFTTGDGSADATMTFTGTVANINTALSNLAFTPDADYIGPASIQLDANDQGNTGAGGPQTDSESVAITVNPPQTIELASSNFTISEGAGSGVGTVTLTRTGGTAGTQVVSYSTSAGTATNGQDFTVAVGSVTFLPGESSKSFTVPITDDAFDENDETINVAIGPVTSGGATIGAQSTGTLTILDDDPTPTVSIGNATVVEGNMGTTPAAFTVTLSAASGRTITVDYASADGTATAGSDYSAATGTLTFTPGQTTKTVMVNVIGDATIEPDETFSVVLSNPSNVTIATATGAGIIADDDDPSHSTLSIANDVTLTEGDTGTSNATFTVNLNAAAAGTVTVDYATVAGTATEGADYTLTTGTLTFTAGQTSKTVTIPIVGDTFDEPNETLSLVLSNPTGGATLLRDTGVLTIADNDPTPSVSIADTSGIEGTGTPGTLSFTVTLSAASNLPVTFDYATSDGTAIANTDYVPATGTVTFAPGETTKTITVNTVPDNIDEDAETFLVTLANLQNAIVGDGQAVGTITDDDAAPSLSINNVTAAEPTSQSATATADFTVTLSAPSSRIIDVDFATAPGTATADADFTSMSGSIEFAPGETTKTISIPILFDGVDEPDETFTVILSNPSNASLGTATGTATIQSVAPNQPPVAADDVVLLAPGQALADINVLANDTDADGDPLTAAVATAPSHGTAAVKADGTIRYTPAAGYSGADSFTYTASDNHGGSSTATVDLTITGSGAVQSPTNPKKTDLFFAGTSGNDSFQITKGKRNQLHVTLNGNDAGTFTANGTITISGGDGDDTLTIGKLKQPVVFFGGDGNDTLIASSKGSILVGGAGNDSLKGGSGKDLLIGGAGADSLDAAGGNDLLISGSTIYDADTPENRQTLTDLLAELSKRGKYATKLTDLAAGVGTSGAKLVPNVTVFDDAAPDTLTGGAGQDIYAARTQAATTDTLNKKGKTESVIEL